MDNGSVFSDQGRRRAVCVWNGMMTGTAIYWLGSSWIVAVGVGFVFALSALIGYHERKTILAGWMLLMLALVSEVVLPLAYDRAAKHMVLARPIVG